MPTYNRFRHAETQQRTIATAYTHRWACTLFSDRHRASLVASHHSWRVDWPFTNPTLQRRATSLASRSCRHRSDHRNYLRRARKAFERYGAAVDRVAGRLLRLAAAAVVAAARYHRHHGGNHHVAALDCWPKLFRLRQLLNYESLAPSFDRTHFRARDSVSQSFLSARHRLRAAAASLQSLIDCLPPVSLYTLCAHRCRSRYKSYTLVYISPSGVQRARRATSLRKTLIVPSL